MDVGFMNPPEEGQMDLMTMMMQMEKLTEYSEPPPSMDFSTVASPQTFYNALTPDLPYLPPFVDPSVNPVPIAGAVELSFGDTSQSQQRASVAAMREMIFRIAAMQPIHIDPEAVKPPKRRNVRISKDPQSVAARHRRERISERIRILQRLVPGGTKMDTASMLDEAIHYVKFLKTQVQSLERAAANRSAVAVGFPPVAALGLPGGSNHSCFGRMYEPSDQGFMNPTTQMLS